MTKPIKPSTKKLLDAIVNDESAVNPEPAPVTPAAPDNTLLLDFAKAALTGLVAGSHYTGNHNQVAAEAFRIAEAMVKVYDQTR